MKIVADANILFSLFNKTSSTSNIINTTNIKLSSPNYALDELSKYKIIIQKKFNIKDFNIEIQHLKNIVNFIDIEIFKQKISEVENLIPDKKDLLYLALAKHQNLPIWSNDKHLKLQNKIPILTTSELISLI